MSMPDLHDLSRQRMAEAIATADQHRTSRIIRARRRRRLRMLLATRLRTLADQVEPHPLRAIPPRRRTA